MATADSTSPETHPTPLLDRSTASNFNPFIGIHAEETIHRCERAISDLGYVISGADELHMELDTRNMFRMFEAAAIALRYEIQSLKQGVQA